MGEFIEHTLHRRKPGSKIQQVFHRAFHKVPLVHADAARVLEVGQAAALHGEDVARRGVAPSGVIEGRGVLEAREVRGVGVKLRAPVVGGAVRVVGRRAGSRHLVDKAN